MQWYENPDLQRIFQFRQSIYTTSETLNRLIDLANRLEYAKPWEWDWENYSGDNADMIGMYYPQDIAGLDTINYFRSKYKPPKQAPQQQN